MQKRGVPISPDKRSTLRLAEVAWPFIAIIILQAALATFSLQMVTSLRAYVAGESLWSKGQHDAIYFLNRYIDTSNPAYLVRYKTALDVPMGDREGRLALERQPADRSAAAAGFTRGGHHPADIPGIIWGYENFTWFPYMRAAMEHWRNAEPSLFQLQELADEVSTTEQASGAQRQAWKARLDGIYDIVRPLALAYSRTLGEGTRFVQSLLLAANLAMASGFVALTMWRLSKFVRHRRAIEDELAWLASHDDLTKLPNRSEFERAVSATLADGTARAVMFIDLDQFKVVNDTGGHAAGDRLLRTIAERVPGTLGNHALLARLGGDEFGVLLTTPTDREVTAIANRLRHTLAELPFIWEGQHFAVSASIGLVRLGREKHTLESAMRAADIACYMAKEKGRNRVHVYAADDAEQAELAGNMGWVQRLQAGLDEDRFVLYAQEIVPISAQAGHGYCEILMRFSERGELVSPGRFIPAAERFGLMPQLDRWVVRKALETIAARLARGVGGDATYSINLSALTLSDEAFVPFVRQQLKRTQVPAQSLCFEITETAAVANLERANAFISALRQMGCRFALDDFGAGMSSFHYLKRLPVDWIKIDGGFVRNMLRDRTDLAVVEMINHLGHVTGMKTVAEFVESAEILVALRGIGVDYAQGYHVAMPQPFLADPVVEEEQRLTA